MKLDFVKETAKKAGKIIKNGFREKHKVRRKKEGWVTKIDKQSETSIVKAIRNKFPSHSILSEETGYYKGDKNRQWYIDPLDGTTNYAQGIPYFSVSIAFVDHGHPTLGVVYNPITQQLFFAECKKGAFLNNNKITVSQKQLLKTSVFIFNRTYQRYSRLAYQTRKLGDALLTARMFGALSLDLCQVAAGYVDGLLNLEASPWDYMAGLLIAEEAGAKVVKMVACQSGKKLCLEIKKAEISSNQALLIVNPKLLKEIYAFYQPWGMAAYALAVGKAVQTMGIEGEKLH